MTCSRFAEPKELLICWVLFFDGQKLILVAADFLRIIEPFVAVYFSEENGKRKTVMHLFVILDARKLLIYSSDHMVFIMLAILSYICIV